MAPPPSPWRVARRGLARRTRRARLDILCLLALCLLAARLAAGPAAVHVPDFGDHHLVGV